MKLDVNAIRYLSKDEFRVLTAVEMGMKNHEIVPADLIESIAGLQRGGTYKNLKTLLKHKLVHHDSSKYDGYRLTTLGYDFLAIKTLSNRGHITGIGRQIGVGKESDIFEVVAEDGTTLALKLHRLGRTSFRAVKSKRDYLKHRRSFNWLYLSRLAALKEFTFMKALGEHGFPVPEAVDWNRHCVLMTLVPGYPLVQVKELQDPSSVLEKIISLVVQLAEQGLIHCDLNEFNIMIDDNETVRMIDFPQMVSVSHRNAERYFNRDMECIFKFFNKRFSYSLTNDCEEGCFPTLASRSVAESTGRPNFKAIANVTGWLDKELAASGFTHQDQEHLDQYAINEMGSNVASDEDEAVDGNSCSESDVEATTSKLQELNASALGTESENDDLVTVIANDKQTKIPNQCHKADDENEDSCVLQGSSRSKDSVNSDENIAHHSRGLKKQRKHAVKALRGVSRSNSSRNASKDKGGRRSQHFTLSNQSDF